jgi:hypothetical protein
MVNKIKSRHVKRRGKHTTRNGYRKYRKHHTRKFGKRIQRRVRRLSRSKKGGDENSVQVRIPINFNSPETYYIGFAKVTKLGHLGPDIFSKKDRNEEIVIFSNDNRFYIARCVRDFKKPLRCVISENVEVIEILLNSLSYDDKSNPQIIYVTSKSNDKYRFKLDPNNNNNNDLIKILEAIKYEKVKVIDRLGGYEDKQASIKPSGKIDEINADVHEEIYTLTIDGKEVNFLMSNIKTQTKEFKLIDDTCYIPYTFTDIYSRKSIKVYVQVLRETGTIFHTINPELADNEDAIFCDDGIY